MPYVETVMLIMQFAQDEISSSWLSRTDTIDKDDHHGRIWSWVFFYYHHYQTSKIVFWIIFHCKTKHPNFIFFIGIHFLMHSFYTKNSIYIEPNTTLISNVEIMSSCHGHNNTHASFINFFFNYWGDIFNHNLLLTSFSLVLYY